jgi:toxin ParE1/3/4
LQKELMFEAVPGGRAPAQSGAGSGAKRTEPRRPLNPCASSGLKPRCAALGDYLMDFNPRAAAHLAESLLAAGDSVANFPHRGRLVRGTSLRELVTVSPYIIRYRVAGDTVAILRVRHTARRPTRSAI